MIGFFIAPTAVYTCMKIVMTFHHHSLQIILHTVLKIMTKIETRP